MVKNNKNQSEIANELGRSRCCIQNYLKSPSSYGINIKNAGRKTKATDRQKRSIRRLSYESSRSLRTLQKDLEGELSHTTIKKELNKMSIYCRKMKPIPILTIKHKIARVEFAKNIMRGGQNGCRNILFSDEKRFNLDGPDGYRCYWHDLRNDKKCFSRRKYGGKSLMVWGCIGYECKPDLSIIQGTLNGKKYQDILESTLVPFLEDKIDGAYLFQQDNASSHTSKATKDFMNENDINVLSWPALSPDLNIIENVWGILTNRVYVNSRVFENVEALEKTLKDEWKKIEENVIKNLYTSFFERCLKVIDVKGAFLG